VAVDRLDGVIVVDSRRGDKVVLQGPVVSGLPVEASVTLRRHAGTPVILAQMVRDPKWAGRMVERTVALEGFPEVRLEDIWVTDGENGSRFVHLRIHPGPRQLLDRVDVEGEDPLGLTVDGVPGIEEGMPLNRRSIGQALARLRSAYRAAGYSDVQVSTSARDDEVDGGSLVITIEPGVQRLVGNVGVEGLRHIRESVILGGLSIEPGEVLLPSDLDTSAVRTASFSPVEKIDVSTRDVGANLTDVTLEVVEKPRWMVEAGAGWSSERGASLQAGFRDDGLLGRGAGLSLRGQLDERQQQVALWVSLPPLPGGRWSMVANTLWFEGDAREDPDRLKEEQRGAALEATYRLTPKTSIRGYGRAAWTEKNVHDPGDILAPFFPIVTQETVIGSQLVWDRLDNPFDPKEGFWAAADMSHSAPSLGSDFNDLRLVLTGVAVGAPISDWTWSQTLRLGAAEPLEDSVLSTDRRFFAGGQATIRGFDLDSVGPLTPAGSVAGGGALFVLNEELRVPIWRNLGAAVFTDLGQVWESWSDASFELSIGAGFGLRYATPVGPLWADVAWPVANLNISTPGPKYYFGLGTTF